MVQGSVMRQKVIFISVVPLMQPLIRRKAISGKAIRSIGRQGRAQDEYNRISDFTVSPEGDFMILDGTTDHIIRFTRNGDFVERMHLESEVSALQSLSSSRLLMGISLWDNSKSKDYHVLLFDRPGSVVKEMASNTHAIDINVTFPSVGFSESDSGYSYLIPLEDRVYEFDVDGNYVRNYYWDFSPSALSEGARKNVELHMEEINNGSFLMLAAFVSNNLIIGNVREKGNFKTFIVDRRENTRYMVESKLGYFFGVSSGKAMFVKDSGDGYVLTFLSL